MWENAISIFQKFMGTGLLVIWFLVALVYLFLHEKDKVKRMLFVYAPVIVLLLYFNPLFIKMFVEMTENEIYFRICWLLPVTVSIAYAVVQVWGNLKGKKAACFGGVCILLVVISGKLVYSSPLYSRAENPYHVPQSVVDICDAIQVPGREVMAAFPYEMLLYVRQYSPVVRMPYGRDAIIEARDEFYLAMVGQTLVLETLVPMARQAGCHYVIVREDADVRGEPDDYGWMVYGAMDGYVIYRDTQVELVIPDMGEK